MQKNKLEKQSSGMFPLNFETTPINRRFESLTKEQAEEFVLSNRSNNDPFGQQAFEDYAHDAINSRNGGDITNPFRAISPMTRSQRAKIADQAKQSMLSPEGFDVDLSKHTHCPMCKQSLPSLIKLSKFKSGTPIKTPRNRKNTVSNTKNGEETKNSKGSPASGRNKPLKKTDDVNNRRKTKGQVKLLEQEMEANSNWTNEDMERIAKKISLSKSQVYKWNWDQRKKMNILPSKVYLVQLPNDMIDSKTGQIIVRSEAEFKKLQSMNLKNIVQMVKK